MQGALARFAVFTWTDQKEIVVAVEGKSLHAYRTRSSCGVVGNKDVSCQEVTKSQEQNWQKGLFSKYLGCT